MYSIQNIIDVLEKEAPLALQENYDNSGIQVGDVNQTATGALLTLDVTEEVVDEAIRKNCNLIISHHPLIFKGLKSITGNTYVERCIIKACKNSIVIYSAHTNYDNTITGVNQKIAEKIGLINLEVLAEQKNMLEKLITFVPTQHAENVRNSLFKAGAGHIGNYDSCSFNGTGVGTFQAQQNAHPYCGEIGKLHQEEEVRIEVIFPVFLKSKIIKALQEVHPYEEPAFDFYPLTNTWKQAGSGIIGDLPQPIEVNAVFTQLKTIFNVPQIKHSRLFGEKIQKIALCGGSGAFLISEAKKKKADLFITGEIKYHDFFGLDDQIIIAEIGHYESEQFTKELFYDIITKNISNFAVHFSDVLTNPVKYF